MLITDLNMPNMDGIELIRQVRALPQYKYMPIVMLTTESQDAKKQAAARRAPVAGSSNRSAANNSSWWPRNSSPDRPFP